MNGDLQQCSFCGLRQKQVRKLIAGPRVYVCDRCVERALVDHAGSDDTVRCAFCGERGGQVEWMHGTTTRICNECVGLCLELMEESRESAAPVGRSAVLPACPHCRKNLTDTAVYRTLDVAGDGDGATPVLFVYCKACSAPIGAKIEPDAFPA